MEAKRFFYADDDDSDYWFVARDLDHAKEILRKTGIEFGYPSVSLDEATAAGDLTWGEVDLARASTIRCNTTDDDRGRGFYLESTRQSDRSVYIVWACSVSCSAALWQRGPGPLNIDEEASRRAIDRRTKDPS